jgi:L-ribulose-5-phosphate 3-epimerase
MNTIDRRNLLRAAAAATISMSVGRRALAAEKLFDISLAQWSLHHQFFGHEGVEKLDPMDFAMISKQQFGIDAVEYVNQFYADVVHKSGALVELKKRADGEGVRNLMIMCDGEGKLGDSDQNARVTAVRNHIKWLEWATELGCHSIRVNAASDSSLTYYEQQMLAVDGLRRLCEIADTYGLNVIVENHGGLSSHGRWLRGVMEKVDHPRIGALPDFGNFFINRGRDGEDVMEYDRYLGTHELMPFAKGVSAKSHEFDDSGNEVHTDYLRILKIVVESGFRGYVGVEFEGEDSVPGIKKTKALLERVRDQLSA